MRTGLCSYAIHQTPWALQLEHTAADGYLAALRASKTFGSPDSTEAMAAAWGVQGALDSLQVSLPAGCAAGMLRGSPEPGM